VPGQEISSNPGSVAFSSFAGISKIDHTRSLCLLSCVSNWQNTWIINTGASDHMCHNKDLFSTLKVLSKPSTVTLPNGKCVSITHTGTVILSDVLTLQGVFYVPNFKYNLLSVNKLASQLDGYVIFTLRHCFMEAPSLKKHLVLGEYYAGLYLLKAQSFTSLVMATLILL